jgi:Tfp pilus assembly protein PilV
MTSPEVNAMKQTKYLLPVLFLLATAFTSQAQIDSIVRAFVDQAARNSQQRQTPQTQPRRQTQPKQQSNAPRQPKKQFDGTWLATQSKTNPDNQQTINRTFTLIIKDGKATKTLDTTNTSTPEKPFYTSVYELQRRWSYNSIDCTEQGTSITIQWSPGQLSDWSPKTVPNPVVEGFGSPMAETSVYKINGDQLTRINDPNGLVFRRAK